MSTTDIAGIDRTKTATLGAWKKQAIHSIVLHSGAVVDIKIPDLPTLLEAGEIPQNLIEQALGTATGTGAAEKPSKETVRRDREFRDTLITLTVVSPKLTLDDVKDIPSEPRWWASRSPSTGPAAG